MERASPAAVIGNLYCLLEWQFFHRAEMCAHSPPSQAPHDHLPSSKALFPGKLPEDLEHASPPPVRPLCSSLNLFKPLVFAIQLCPLMIKSKEFSV